MLTRSAFSFAALFAIVGCGGGSSDLPDLGYVTGTVSHKGQPLANANVIFVPLDGGTTSTGFTDEFGQYSLRFTAGNEGAIVGNHVVKITVESEPVIPDGVDPDNMTPAQEKKMLQSIKQLPPQYNEVTELGADVQSGSNVCDFDLDADMITEADVVVNEDGGGDIP